MDDLIYRQDAIKAVGYYHCQSGDKLLFADNALKEIPSAQQWIPCDEKLPEEDGVYIVTTSKGQVQLHVFNTKGNSKEYWMRCNKSWMPLPEPFEEDANETD